MQLPADDPLARMNPIVSPMASNDRLYTRGARLVEQALSAVERAMTVQPG